MKLSPLFLQRFKVSSMAPPCLPLQDLPSSSQKSRKHQCADTYRPSNLCFKKSNNAFCIISVTCNEAINEKDKNIN